MKIEKKEYIIPALQLMEIGTSSVLALSTDESQTDDENQMVNKHTGSGAWGDVWNK